MGVLTKDKCKVLAFRVKMTFMPHGFAGGVYRVEKKGFVKDWIETKVSQAVWDAKWRQLEQICKFLEEQDDETHNARLDAMKRILYPE